jgi:FlaA1/EpsC-like NDP-sugar epimerase
MLSHQSTRRSVLLLQRDARRLPRAGGLPAAATAAWVGAVQLLSVPSSSSLAVASVPTRQFSLSRRVSARDLSTEPAQKLNVKRLAVIGGGNMAEAVVTALASKGLIDPAGIVVSDPNPSS